jgi:hypothetical protein
MATGWRAREIIVDELDKTSMAPFDVSSSATFVRDIAEFNHKKKPGDEVDRIFMLFLICGFQKV